MKNLNEIIKKEKIKYKSCDLCGNKTIHPILRGVNTFCKKTHEKIYDFLIFECPSNLNKIKEAYLNLNTSKSKDSRRLNYISNLPTDKPGEMYSKLNKLLKKH